MVNSTKAMHTAQESTKSSHLQL